MIKMFLLPITLFIHSYDYFQDCNWCGTGEAPDDISWKTTIPPKNEPGEKLIISGIVYDEDGITPAPNVIVYVHHTNDKGVYPKRGDEKGNGKLHGYLRGWMRTDKNGQYKFETIKPSPYQTHGGEPAHIHYSIQVPGEKEYWLTALWFANDPRVTKEQLEKVKRPGGKTNVTHLSKIKGVWYGKRDIVLGEYE